MKKTRKRNTLIKSLPSEQWLSESTRSRAGTPRQENGLDSPSPSNGLPDACKALGPVQGNVSLKERKTIIHYQRPPDGIGYGWTRWRTFPQVSIAVVCDGRKKQWVCRVSSAECRQEQYIGEPDDPVDYDTIAKADCKKLRDMDKLIRENISKTGGVIGYLPVGYVQVHENVHLSLNSEAARMRYAELVGRISAITRPCVDFPGPLSAEEDMSAEIDAARNRFIADLTEDTARFGRHEPAAPFLAAQSQFCAPFLAAIAAAIKEKCP